MRRIEGRFIQTIKSADNAGSPWVRHEHETPVASFEPSRAHLLEHLPGRDGADATFGALRPIFETRLTRRRLSCTRQDGTVEAVFDQGNITAAGRSSPILEVEHELKVGKPSALSRSCLEFLERSPCAIGTEGKAARGYRLWRGGEAQPVYHKKLRVVPEMQLPEAFHKILNDSFSHTLANVPALADTGVAGSIHQMRVGLRRMRSALYAFKPILDQSGAGDLAVGIKRFFALLGDVRDADVFLSDVLPTIPNDVLPMRSRRLLIRLSETHRAVALSRLQASLASEGFARLVVEIDTWIEGRTWLAATRPIDRLLNDRRIGEFAAARLRNMHRKFIKLGRRAVNGTLEDWHQVRIMSKKLRYAGQPLLAALHDDAVPGYAKNLARLQETLGHINDAHNVRAYLDNIRRSVPARSDSAFAEAAAYCIGWGAASAQAASRVVADGWRDFEATGPFIRSPV